MKTKRIESFSDGVLAVVITITVLGITPPKGFRFEDLLEIMMAFSSYGTSFFFVGIYWLKHHNLFHIATETNSKIAKANLNFLFWISLLPFATNWDNNSVKIEKVPMILYGVIWFITALSYKLLEHFVLKNEFKRGKLKQKAKIDFRSHFFLLLILLAVIVAFSNPELSSILLFFLSLSLLIPDKRLEKIYYGNKKINRKKPAMSRAFTSEEREESPLLSPRAHLPFGAINYVTPNGLAELKTEKKELINQREELLKDSAGDNRVQINYLTAKLNQLNERLNSAKLVELSSQPQNEIHFGAKVTVVEKDRELIYQIVGVDEADISLRKISFLSPIATALMGKKVGAMITLEIPSGIRKMQVKKIEY